MALPPSAESGAGSALGIAVLVVIAAWALMFAVMFGLLIYLTVLRGRRQRGKRVEPGPAVPADPNLRAVLEQARQADPYFDEQLLLDASQLICLILFAAISTGDEEAVRRLAAPSFWSTFFGRYTRNAARSARLQRAQEQGRPARLAPPRAASGGLPGNRARADQPRPSPAARVHPGFVQPAARGGGAGSGRPDRGGVGDQPVVARDGVRRRLRRAAEQFGAGPLVAVLGRKVRPRLHPPARCEDRPAGGDRQPDLLRAAGRPTGPNSPSACAHCHAERPAAWDTWRLAEVTIVE